MGFDWAWIDTCCIDKQSSAELSEAINAMFKWYEHAGECSVHLSDVEYSPHELHLKKGYDEDTWLSAGWPTLKAKFQKSSWFTRGWTLQELLAPQRSKIMFFDRNWNEIGGLPLLAKDVSEITGIEESYMGFKQSSSEKGIAPLTPSAMASVAKRISWASSRQTSREEDMAYCLLELFDVKMPLLYGEGAEKAFYRLQVEIMDKSDDESLLAWTSNKKLSGMLAASPSCFAHSGDICRGWRGGRRPYRMTNKGLEFSVPTNHIAPGGTTGYIIVFLDCFRDDEEKVPLALHLQEGGGFGAYRTRCDHIDAVQLSADLKSWTLDKLYKDLQDSRVIYVFDPSDEGHQTRLILHILMSEEKTRLHQETPNKAAQNFQSDGSMIEASSQTNAKCNVTTKRKM